MSQSHREFLHGIDAFSTLSDAALGQLEGAFQQKRYGAGAQILRRGDPGDSMFVIREGEVKVPVLDAHGREKLVARLGPGEVFGEMALMTGDPRSADVFAESAVTALILPQEPFRALIKQYPSVANFLTRILADRLAAGDMSHKRIGKYTLEKELGRGGMAVVYDAVHSDLHRLVAMKMLSHRLAFDEGFSRDFQREARIIAQLRHPNIVQVYDTEKAYATYFIVMEYVEGTLLEKAISSRGRIPPNECRRICRQIAQALGYAHAHGIVHRDVKPSNVFLDERGDVKLMDFGIARIQQEEVAEEEIVGTAEFMSPEQCRGDNIDGRTDIYSLGITAYKMLTGEVPFQADDPYDVLAAQLSQPVPPVMEKVPDCPDDLARFVARATEKGREHRYQSGEEAARALEAPTGAGERRLKVVSLAYPPEHARRVDDALAQLKRDLCGTPGGVQLAVADLRPEGA